MVVKHVASRVSIAGRHTSLMLPKALIYTAHFVQQEREANEFPYPVLVDALATTWSSVQSTTVVAIFEECG